MQPADLAPQHRASPLHIFFKLDSFYKPGIPSQQFKEMFSKCNRCDLVTTRRSAAYHRCANPEPVPQPNIFMGLVDLTLDSDDDDEIIDLTLDSD
jgi:hypothetical protein